MEKTGHDSLLLTNWRPLTLLNVDYKIFSKTIANRLQEVMDDITHRDQSGFMRGRYIGENLVERFSDDY